jgi:two-component system response regulator AtoC
MTKEMSSSESDEIERDGRTKPTEINRTIGESPSPKLVAFWDGGSLTRLLPAEGELTIGRSSACDVRIDHPSVSRKHAVLHVGVVNKIEDASSANGTRVAGRELASGALAPIVPGEVVEVGDVVLVIQGADAEAAERASRAKTTARAKPPAPATTIAPPPNTRANETPMERLERLVKLVAAGNIHVLVTGETGTGKEVVAERVHKASRRASGGFFRIEPTAVAESVLDHELFGDGTKPGLLETADGGTILIEEVSELPLGTQARMIRVFERGEVVRIDTSEVRKVDVRFIAATNRDLRAMVSEGTFREELYFRLNGITIEVPPLRERREQIATIANELLEKACVDAGRPVTTLTKEALARLESYDWPGNVRELKNAIERAVLLSQGEALDPMTLPAGDGTSDADKARLRNDLAAFERQRIVEALEKCAGNQTKAAQLLGISRRTLVSRLGEYNLPRPRGGGQK